MTASKIIGAGLNNAVEMQVDPSHRALRASLRPLEIGALGSYSQSFISGAMAANLAGASPIFAWQWANPGVLCRVTRVLLQAMSTTTGFAATQWTFDLLKASQFTSQLTSGANVTLTPKDGARASRFGGSLQRAAGIATGAVAISNTATLANGTPAPTLDNNPMARIVGIATTGVWTQLFSPTSGTGLLVDPTEAAKQHLEFVNNEGFVIKATVPATGTWSFTVSIDWDEVDLLRYMGLFS